MNCLEKYTVNSLQWDTREETYTPDRAPWADGDVVRVRRVALNTYSFAESVGGGARAVARALTWPSPSVFSYSPFIRKYNWDNKTFPVGMLPNVLAHCAEADVQVAVRDWSYPRVEEGDIDDRLKGARAYQAEAVQAFFTRRTGIIQVPTRGGKTFIAAECIRQYLNRNATGAVVFVVDNVTLFNQARGDLETFFAPYGGLEVGGVNADRIDITKRVTVVMIQTLLSAYKKRADVQRWWRKDVHFLIVDEVHDNSSTLRLKQYRAARAVDHQLALSATPYRSRDLVTNLRIQAWTGGVVYQISEEQLLDAGVLSEYRVFELMVDHTLRRDELRGADYSGVRTALIWENEERDKMLCSVISMLQRLGLKTLVLFQSVAHGQAVSRRGGWTFISGDTPGEDRETAKRVLLDDKRGGVLLASNIFHKGVTLPAVAVMINADEGLEDANVVQRKGRVLGTAVGKTRALILDWFDVFPRYLTRHSRARLETYVREVGEDKVSILDTGQRGWLELLEEWTREWFAPEPKTVLTVYNKDEK